MHITAKVDYAVRAVLEIAAQEATVTASDLAAAQDIPAKFLEAILGTLARAGILSSHRGPSGGYGLGRPAKDIPIADIVRAIDGPLAAVRGLPPEELTYTGPAEGLREVWIAARSGLRLALESVTVADLLAGVVPAPVARLLDSEGAYRRR